MDAVAAAGHEGRLSECSGPARLCCSVLDAPPHPPLLLPVQLRGGRPQVPLGDEMSSCFSYLAKRHVTLRVSGARSCRYGLTSGSPPASSSAGRSLRRGQALSNGPQRRTAPARRGRMGAAERVGYHVGGHHPAARSSSVGRSATAAHGAGVEGRVGGHGGLPSPPSCAGSPAVPDRPMTCAAAPGASLTRRAPKRTIPIPVPGGDLRIRVGRQVGSAVKVLPPARPRPDPPRGTGRAKSPGRTD